MRLGGRLHARALDVIVEPPARLHGRLVQLLRAPKPGWFVPAAGHGAAIQPGGVLGTLEILGVPHALLVPRAGGTLLDPVADAPPHAGLAMRAVGFGDVLAMLDLEAESHARGELAEAGRTAPEAAGDRVFRAPTSGRFYGRPGPDKPPFVSAGAELAAGATICLLEVMKTFHRVTYTGEPARVKAVLVADGDDVNAGDPLLSLE